MFGWFKKSDGAPLISGDRCNSFYQFEMCRMKYEDLRKRVLRILVRENLLTPPVDFERSIHLDVDDSNVLYFYHSAREEYVSGNVLTRDVFDPKNQTLFDLPVVLDQRRTRLYVWNDRERLLVLSATCFTPDPKGK